MLRLEVCVDTAAGLDAAIAGGADRVELCSALGLGGLTPSPGLIARAARSAVPTMAMIRPRPGDFVYSDADLEVALSEIDAIKQSGLAGVVIGANLAGGALDVPSLTRLVAAADGLDITLHRSIDLTPDPVRAMQEVVDLGIQRVLSSGGSAKAVDGLARLTAMMAAGGGDVSVMPGSGVTPQNVVHIVQQLGVTEVHASCSGPMDADRAAVALEFAGDGDRQTSKRAVQDMVRSLRAINL